MIENLLQALSKLEGYLSLSENVCLGLLTLLSVRGIYYRKTEEFFTSFLQIEV